MPASISEWDARYLAQNESEPAEPEGIVKELLPLLPLGPALDLACGTGRHTLLLAARPQPVLAVDGSKIALDLLEKRSRTTQLSVRRETQRPVRPETRTGHVRLAQADLERIELPGASFSLILCIHYLQRSLHPQIEHALLPGGMLVFETFTRAQLEFDGGPRNPAFLLEPGELRTAFPSLEVVFYRELRAGQGIATLLARRPGAAS